MKLPTEYHPNKKLFVMRLSVIFLLVQMVFPWNILSLINFDIVKNVEAESATITSSIDFNSGTYMQTEAASKSGQLRLQSSGTWNARVWKTPAIPLGDQTAVVSDGTYLYVKPAGDNLFLRYSSAENRWKELASSPRYSFQGSDMKRIGDSIYATFGGYQKDFYKYSISQNTWTQLENAPDLMQTGSSIGTDGTNIFAIRGTATTDFWKYTVATDTWSTLTSAPLTLSTGASLIYSDGYFYTPRGANTQTFYRYDVNANSWSAMTNAPATLNSNGNITVNGDYIYVLRGASTNTFYRYSISGNSWTTLTNTPQVTGFTGVVYHAEDGYVYVFRGNNTQEMWKYDIEADSFVGLTDLPIAPGTGADLINHQGYLYYVRGSATTALYRYDLGGGTWSAALAAFPATMGDDVKGASAGANLYFPRGSSTTTFYRYNPSGNAFTTLTAAPATLGAGSAVAYPGTGDYLYVTRGLNTRTFYRYSITGNTWDDAGAADIPDDAEAGIGARMITNGTDIYYISGLGTSRLLKYTVATDTWSSVGNVPFSTYYGTDMNFHNGRLYLQAGYYKQDFWEFNISTSEWRKLPDIQSNFAYDQGPYNGASLASDGGGNLYSTMGASSLWWQKYSIGSDNYPENGTWTSDIIDLNYVSSWTSLSATTDTPGSTAVTFETRSSENQSAWSSWQSVSSGTIASPVGRYVQIRATLGSSDQIQTPVIHDMTITYAGDEIAPTNVSSVTGSSQAAGGVAITTGNTYGYTNPYFTWSGAGDAQTSIAGYYVYFGTSNSADPETDGTFQTATTYTVTTPLSNNTYYLRVKAIDESGNVSSPITGFTYIYAGLTAQTTTKSTSADFSGGVETTVSTLGDEIKLASKSGFWQQDRLSIPPAAISSGAGWGYVESTNKLYTFRGANTTTFYEYDIDTDVWTTKTVAPATVTTGGALAGGPSGYVYGIRGNNTTTFWRYDPDTNTWDDAAAADAPQPFNSGSSLVYDGEQYIYALKGNADDTFLRYDAQSDVWETLANTDFGATSDHLVNTVNAGGNLAYDGNDTLYAIQGGGYSGFSAYSISSNSWTTLPNLPLTPAAEGAQISYDSASSALYFSVANSKTAFLKFDISSQTWSQLADSPAPLSLSSAMRNVNGVLYILRGGATQNFYTYHIAKASWRTANYGLFGNVFRGTDIRTFTTGAQIVKGAGDNYYILRGAVDSIFAKYNATTGEITKLSDAPVGFTTGATFTYDSTNDKMYALANNLSRRLFVYDATDDYWYEESADQPPFDPAAGVVLRYDGSRYIYYLRGAGTTSFYRYDTQGIAGSRWSSALAVAPGTIGAGSEMIIKGGYIYTLRGNNQISFYRYDINAGTWSDPAVADLPVGVTVGADGFLADGGGDVLYACRGLNTSTCYEYSINSNSWTITTNAPANITTGGDSASNYADKIFVIAGPGANTFSNGLYSFVMQTDESSFQESGGYESASFDLGSVYKFANLSISYTAATNATVAMSTRTSEDNSTWSSWSQGSEVKTGGNTYEYKINSQPNRYIQIKAELTSGDSLYSGVIQDYSISYYADQTEPTNPTAFTAYNTSTQSAVLTTNNWYNNASPYFSWPVAEASGGASDGTTGSGIAEYYVYFGTDAVADPEDDGSLQSEVTYTGSGLTSGSTYYLRIKTVDAAGNVSENTWQPFIYKYDNEAPENPTTVTADPPGYTATNSFDFAWSGATDSASGVADYCYKTLLAGSETCGVSEEEVLDVVAGGTGASTFYVRARDAAGNKATTYVSVSYYYSSTAPSAPRNLVANPTSNTVNEFAFTWTPPELFFGAQASIRYYYSINAIPTAQNVNTVGLTTTYLTAGAYATVPGDNILYVLAKDEAGNIDYNNYAQVTFTADTSAPGVIRNIDISDVSVKATENWRLAVSWDAPIASGSGVASYRVYRSASETAVCTTDFDDFSYAASTTTDSYVDTGLTQQTYAYCVKACDSTNNCSAVSDTISLTPDGKWTEAPELTASPSATFKTKSAKITWSTSRTSNSFVKYGTSSGDYGQEVGSSEQVAAHAISLTGLEPGTTYYYKVLWTDEDGNTGESDEASFTTDPAPVISAVKMSNVSMYSAYVNFKIKNATNVVIKYGKTVAYGGTESIATSKSEASHTVVLSELTEGTTYNVQIEAEDDEGNTFSSDNYTFETLPVPKVVAAKVTQVAGQPTATVRVIWSTNTPISSIVTYYPTNAPSLAQDQISLALKRSHQMVLRNLRDDQEYTILIKGKDSAGNDAQYSPISLRTALDFRAPEISNVAVESTVIGVGDEARAQVVVSWDTDEPATTQVEYGEGTGGSYSQKTQEDTNLTTNHVVTLSGLNPAKIYSIRALSEDKADNKAISQDSVVVTPRSTKSAFNIVIENLSKTFKFLEGI